MNVIKKLSLLTVLIVISSCSRGFKIPVGHDAPGLEELKRLCAKDAGLTINKTVEAEGYYDATRKGGVLHLLIPSEYRFTEYCNFEPTKTSLSDEPGCFRLTKVSRETGQCNEIVDKVLKKSGKDTTIKFREHNCIAVEKLEKPMARYSYKEGLKSWLAKNGISKFRKSYARIKDTKTGELLSEYISYSYNKTPGLTSSKGCHLINEKFSSYIETNIIKSTIKSTQGEIE